MPNLYFCQSVRNPGILRAVLSWEESAALLKHYSTHYVGQQFPKPGPGPATDLALVRIFDEEADDDWRAGFYRLDADIMQIEEALRACQPAPVGRKSRKPIEVP